MQNVEFRVVWAVRFTQGHQQPFDTAHTISYLTLVELCIYLILFSYVSKVAHFNLSHLHLVPLLGLE